MLSAQSIVCKTIFRSFTVAALFASLLLAQTAKDRTVVLISLDGFPAFALEDPKASVPTLRKLAREGSFAPRMKGTNPTVTWPAHTTMITGVPPAQHRVLYNGMLFRDGTDKPPKVVQWRPKTEMVKAPTVYDLAYQAGLTTAEADWVAVYEAPTITYPFPEIPSVNGKIEKEMIADGIVTAREIETFGKSIVTWRDNIWTEAAAYILRKHKPNLMMYHPLNLDSTHHRYGPGSLASYTGLEYADKQVARLVDAVRDAGMADRTTFLIVADHGFRVVKKNIQANAVLRANGLITGEGAGVRCDAWGIPEGGTAMIYITDPAKREQLTPRLRQIFQGVEGVAKVYEPSEYGPLGLPLPKDSDQAPDLLLAAKPGYAFGGASSGEPVTNVAPNTTPGSHGYLATDPDMETFLIAWGRGIKAGVRLGPVNSVDVAPTVARLLGLKMEGVAGHVLNDILK